MKKKFYVADDVADMLNVSKTTAYRIIHNLNYELKARGYITVAGRVPKTFFDRRFYSEEMPDKQMAESAY
ncbi:MAG: transcriptional regulator [Clostridia bacterium]|nr:transcriptional regulator [Clostridia bacterium]